MEIAGTSPIGPFILTCFDDRRQLTSADARDAGILVDEEVAPLIVSSRLKPITERRKVIGPHRLEYIFLPSGPNEIVSNETEAREWARANSWRFGTPSELVAAFRNGNPFRFFDGTNILAPGMVVEDRDDADLRRVRCVALHWHPIKPEYWLKLVPCQLQSPPTDMKGEFYLLTRIATT